MSDITVFLIHTNQNSWSPRLPYYHRHLTLRCIITSKSSFQCPASNIYHNWFRLFFHSFKYLKLLFLHFNYCLLTTLYYFMAIRKKEDEAMGLKEDSENSSKLFKSRDPNLLSNLEQESLTNEDKTNS